MILMPGAGERGCSDCPGQVGRVGLEPTTYGL